ncbi:NAD(P) transhydrogenase [Saprolegnia diclina VS20]|uniref:NAD(P)(+) transhydrogenase (Si-specific) n=1 Tax=Saprolegnia diclina (strain VS20) TaxID=1156394 RepID=T0Q032_SAPDV|nr:NAD(P) transhydrogenase [Saprolegnia diclina VS20]EQC27866.1 NAD(P) transhydrogenase [Saprolegnia diclina VS20]|eukprot:XP_008618796.1 NAD(P) transhydrogenase [Saprolegnia diclina VS20]
MLTKLTRRPNLRSLATRHATTTSLQLKEYDLVVIGSGPSAVQCAIESVKKGKTVAVIDKKAGIGGVCVHTGTIPSKTFRESVLHLSGFRHQGFYGKSYARDNITLNDILGRVNTVVSKEMDVIQAQLKAARVDLVPGLARFENENEVSVEGDDGQPTRLRGKKFLVACGTRPAHSPLVPCDGKVILDSDQILNHGTTKLPKSWIVVGAGVIGMEYASMLNVLPGINVTVVDGRAEILSFCDDEIVSSLKMEMRHKGARFLLGESIKSVEHFKNGVKVEFNSGKAMFAEALLYCVGRQANTDGLNLEAVGLSKNHRGLITVNEQYQTSHPHIYAAGDCIGAPSLASTSMEQGRLAACDMWSDKDQTTSQLESGNYPYGIYTIPEISMVGKTEQQLTKEGANYAVGLAKFSELAKGQMSGDIEGILKLLFDPVSLQLLGVHAIGHGATEIIHIGQVAMAMNCKLTYFRDAVFNYPTLAEGYRVAALNGLGRLTKEQN